MVDLSTSARWITARRIRAHGLVLALCLWSVYTWNMAPPGLLDRANNLKGTDFLHFYTLGTVTLSRYGADLYNSTAQSQLAAQRVPVAAGIRYLPLYPPQVSIFFAPFARLSYSGALITWLLLSSLIYFLCCYSIWRVSPHLRAYWLTVGILALACPAFWHLIAWGQTSALALACFTLTYFALRAKHEFLAGLAFGCLVFKPQLALAGAIVFAATLNWRLIAGTFISAIAQFAAAWVYYGSGPLYAWLRALRHVPGEISLFEPRLYQTHCLRTFWSMIVPWPPASLALYAITAAAVLVLSLACWRSRLPLSLRYSELLLASVLVAPHLTVYDLVILCPAFLLLCDWVAVQPSNPTAAYFKSLLYLAFALPLAGPLARWTHFQLSVPVMFALLYGIWKVRSNSALPFEP